jgi:tetratricopeptide (TPR) repeat protein/DNA-binding MarR family transcriptional regulator
MPKLVISQNERILLHLSELDRYRDDPDVPMGVSQEGIAQRLGTQVFNASRSLSSLESEGLVFDRLAHVRGAPKRRRAYFLTEKGRTAASAIRADIGTRYITLEHAGKVQELLVDEAVRKLKSLLGRTVAVSEVVELAREFDPLLSSSLSGPSEAITSAKEFVLRSHGRPKVDSFFGREHELKTFSEGISGGEKRAILLWGLPGIGKSTLGSKVFESLIGRKALFWYSFREWDTETSFLSVFTEFLQASGRTGTASSFKRGVLGAELYVPLVNDLHGLEFALFLDDVQKPSRDPSPFVSLLVGAVRASGNGVVVLISRSVPGFFSTTEADNVSVELSGMDRDSAWKLAKSLNVKDTGRIVDESHGNPLLLNLMARGNVAQAKGDIISFVEREVSSSLTPDEQLVLEMLSIFRHPVPLDALGEVQYRTVTELRRRALVIEGEDGVSTHDILRDFFSSHLTTEAKESLHRRAAAYCERMVGIEWLLESLYHHVEGRDWKGSSRVATLHAVELAREFPQETLVLLQRIDGESLDVKDRAEFMFVRGQLNESAGRIEPALADFGESLALLSSEADAAKRALVLEASARLHAQVQRWSESISTHHKALQLYEKSGDKDGQAREWLNIGGVFRKKGDLVKAREAYTKALSLSTMSEDRQSQAACLNNMGLLDWDEGKVKESEQHLKESVGLAHAVKDHSGEARGLENMGELLRSQGRLKEAVESFLGSSDAFRRAGEASDYKRLIASAAELMGLLGRSDEGVALCEKTLSRPELRRRKGLFQSSSRYDEGDLLLSSTLVELHRSKGDLGKAEKELSRYVDMSESVPDPALLAKGKLLIALVKEDIGDLDAAVRSLNDAADILRTVGDSRGQIAVHMRRGVVFEKKGEYSGAEKDYIEAARQAELIGDKAALELANANLRSLAK